MPSPFPGMDPYLEAPDIWPDFHHALATEIRGELNRLLPPAYYAQLEMRPEIGIVGDDESRRIIPDVAVSRTIPSQRTPSSEGGLAVLDRPRAELSPSVWMEFPDEPIRHFLVEVRDSSKGRTLVTLIEIVSPSNKRPGADREAYEAKQRQVSASDASLIEIDLLRAGRSVVGWPMLAATTLEPKPDYLVAVNRAWQRGGALRFQLFPVQLDDRLPCIPVPLRQHEDEVQLDLQFAFQQVYNGGPYARGAVDYSQPPDPPARPELAEWVAQRVANRQ